jgi:hypothetical protein
MQFYLNWYNSRFVPGWGKHLVNNDPYFQNINMDLFKTNLEYIDYLKLWEEEKFILEKISKDFFSIKDMCSSMKINLIFILLFRNSMTNSKQ